MEIIIRPVVNRKNMQLCRYICETINFKDIGHIHRVCPTNNAKSKWLAKRDPSTTPYIVYGWLTPSYSAFRQSAKCRNTTYRTSYS